MQSPASAKVASLDMQVQVQTTYGVSRQATATFPRCNPSCQNGGTCWWNVDIGDIECRCANISYYGTSCENSTHSSARVCARHD